MLIGYSAVRQQVTDALEALSRLASERGMKQAYVAASDALHRLSENRFNLVVFGEFKRGKSTFLNSLLGRNVLPTAVIPLTSIVTVVQYGEQGVSDARARSCGFALCYPHCVSHRDADADAATAPLGKRVD
jgi:replication fork clamp-binding protein CrfC